MTRLFRAFALLAFVCLNALGGQYHLLNGDTIEGEPSAMTEEGVSFRLSVGGFSDRVGWARLTQETLQELAKNPKAKPFAEPFIEIAPEAKQKPPAHNVKIKLSEPSKVALPSSKSSFFAAMLCAPGILILAALYLGGIYAGYEVALFKGRPIALGCAISAILPILGPLVLLAIPPSEAAAAAPPPILAPVGSGEVVGNPLAGDVSKFGGSSLGLAGHSKGGKAGAEPQIWRKADNNFERKFFETKFTGFFRVVVSDAEKDLVIVLKTAKGEIIGKRISRITGNELHLVLLKGTSEAAVSFSDILEVQLRHKDAKA